MNASEILGQVAQLEHHLGGHVRYLLGAAQACPFGGNHDWDKVLAQYCGKDARHDPPLKRLEEAQAAGQSRGATLSEVRRAAEGLRTQATEELGRILSGVPAGPAGTLNSGHPQLDQHVAALRARLTQVPDEVATQHASAVCPPKHAVAASVNSVFANATATAKLTPWANVKFDATKVLECRSCGAPQQVELDFLCRYCRTPMT